ncbi:restriction endonuclease subunit S [Botrimarina sp.]|uniref:restriction endonuclease subunit S n=1 Tax=Botrimarina sp. TaxID=2795802 RepID=UPI0032EFC772
MSPEEFFEKFETFAVMPGAIDSLRYLIRQKAVSGGFSQGDTETWEIVAVDDLVQVQNGFAFKSSFFNEVQAGMPLIRIRDIAQQETQVYYSGEYREEFIVSKGDLLIGMDGNFNIHRWKGQDALLNQRVCRLLEPDPRIDTGFLFLAMQEHLDEIHRNTTFTTVKHISGKQIKAIEFALPPLAEQKRIVAKVDALMGWCDRLEALQAQRDTQHAALARAALARFAENPTPQTLQALFHDQFPINPNDLLPLAPPTSSFTV